MAQVQWFITVGDGRQGPFSSGQVREFVNQGRLSPSMGIRRSDMTKAVRASSVAGLFPDGATTTSMHNQQQVQATPTQPAAAPPPGAPAPTGPAPQQKSRPAPSRVG